MARQRADLPLKIKDAVHVSDTEQSVKSLDNHGQVIEAPQLATIDLRNLSAGKAGDQNSQSLLNGRQAQSAAIRMVTLVNDTARHREDLTAPRTSQRINFRTRIGNEDL